jgi:putative sporulation protein YtaF
MLLTWLSILVFAFALSFDNFAVGVSYGVRRISIPVVSLVIISLTSSLAVGVSMVIGHLLASLISVELAKGVGSFILIGLGGWILLQAWIQRKDISEVKEESASYQILKIRIRTLGLVIQILKEPHKADWDRSGNISTAEALLLGMALAMDAFGAGFGAAMAGFKSWIIPLVVGVVSLILISSGLYLGRSYAPQWLHSRAAIIQGGVLVLLGLVRIVQF